MGTEIVVAAHDATMSTDIIRRNANKSARKAPSKGTKGKGPLNGRKVAKK